MWQVGSCCTCVLTGQQAHACDQAGLRLLLQTGRSSCVPFAPTQLHPYVFCRDWEVLDSQISLSPSRLSKITVVQNLLVATVTFQVPTSCDGSKTLTVGLGG